ncbi:hypothetical protein Tco_0133740 [Tanacetum coccineum]
MIILLLTFENDRFEYLVLYESLLGVVHLASTVSEKVSQLLQHVQVQILRNRAMTFGACTSVVNPECFLVDGIANEITKRSSGHVLRATRVQIPEDDLDNLHPLREEDGTLVFVDPQDLLGSCLGDSDSRTLVLEGTS